jgi:uncharacterized protein (TIGR02147 family)
MGEASFQNNFRDLLRTELVARIKRNPGYSLRAFARSLGVSPATISIVISGKKPVTLSLIRRVAPALKLTSEKVKNYQIELIQSTEGQSGQKTYQMVELDQVAIISDWYHYAILNLMRTTGFKAKPLWISRRLGIKPVEAQMALERLIRVGLLSVRQAGKLTDVSSGFTSHIKADRTTHAARENQRQFFELGRKAIDDVEFSSRNHTGVTLAFNVKDLARAKDMIAEFRRKFHETFDQSGDADAVYHLCLGLFPLSKENSNK